MIAETTVIIAEIQQIQVTANTTVTAETTVTIAEIQWVQVTVGKSDSRDNSVRPSRHSIRPNCLVVNAMVPGDNSSCGDNP